MVHQVLIIGAALAALTSPAAQAMELPCASRAKAISELSSGYDEIPVAAGLTEQGQMVEVFTSARTSTWTILVTLPNGMSCVLAMGEGWESLKPLAMAPDA